ncbi:hypothetical protein N8639_02220 [bacterium]|nr:hypothetical protein [bacterium]
MEVVVDATHRVAVLQNRRVVVTESVSSEAVSSIVDVTQVATQDVQLLPQLQHVTRAATQVVG